MIIQSSKMASIDLEIPANPQSNKRSHYDTVKDEAFKIAEAMSPSQEDTKAEKEATASRTGDHQSTRAISGIQFK